MNNVPKVIAIGVVDEQGIASTCGIEKTWSDLETEAPGNSKTFRALTGNRDQTFRRLDRATRALVLAAEASGISQLLTAGQRHETALVIETSRGCIEADLRYARLLKTGIVHAAIFPYTLQSTCLGDVALRHGLRGQTLSLSVEPGEEGESLREAARILQADGPRYAIAGVVDVLEEQLPNTAPRLRALVCIVAAASEPANPVAPWPGDSADPFASLIESCRANVR